MLLAEPEVVRRTLRALDLSGARRQATALAENAAHDFAEWPNGVERLNLLSYGAHLVSIEDPDRGLSMLQDLLSQYEALPPHGDHADTLYRIASQHLARGDSGPPWLWLTNSSDLARATGNLLS